MDYDHSISLESYSSMDKAKESKKEQINSSIRNYEWAADDYDRRHGKGSYFKKFPETKAVLDQLYEHKQKCMNHEALEVLKEASASEDED